MPEFAIKDFTPLFDQLLLKYNIDLFKYASASLERRMERFLALYPFQSIKDFGDKLIADVSFFDLFIKEITVNTTEMFRDPETWRIIRHEIIPLVKENPTIRIWHAGCSSGEEVYSMAILLLEEGVLEKSKIVASDLNKEVLQLARKGIYSLKSIQLNEENYIKAGGKKSFKDYYTKQESSIVLNPSLISDAKFLKHDLSTGTNFSKFDLILCRNVLIYFNKELQERVFNIFQQSLFKKGFIILGKKESMAYYSNINLFNEFDMNEKVYRLK